MTYFIMFPSRTFIVLTCLCITNKKTVRIQQINFSVLRSQRFHDNDRRDTPGRTRASYTIKLLLSTSDKLWWREIDAISFGFFHRLISLAAAITIKSR